MHDEHMFIISYEFSEQNSKRACGKMMPNKGVKVDLRPLIVYYVSEVRVVK